MSHLAVKIPSRPYTRSKSSTRINRSYEDHSDRDSKPLRRSSKRTIGDAYDDVATATFVRKVLCAGHLKPGQDSSESTTLEGQLPPLSSSNEIDLQIYAIIAVVIKDFVHAWYSKITPDHQFTDEVIQIIAHCSRGLEQRLRRVDLESLFLDEIPSLLIQHTERFRTAHATAGSATGGSLGCDARIIYHAMEPHPALSPSPDTPASISAQHVNEQAWRQLLIEGVLQEILPPEDLQNPCLKALVSELFSEMIVGNVVGGKLSQGWALWDIITKVIHAVQPSRNLPPEPTTTRKSTRLDQFGLLETTTQGGHTLNAKPLMSSIYAAIVIIGWELVRISVLLVTTSRSALITFTEAAQLPSRLSCTNPLSPACRSVGPKAPILALSALALPAQLLNLPQRLPWLTSLVALAQHHAIYGPGHIAAFDGRLDRLLASQISAALSPAGLPQMLKIVRASVFPDNSLAASVPPPSTPEELAAVRERAARAVLGLVPENVRGRYFGREAGEARQLRVIEEEFLGLFEDDYLNKHWIFAVIEVIFCRLFPEIACED